MRQYVYCLGASLNHPNCLVLSILQPPWGQNQPPVVHHHSCCHPLSRAFPRFHRSAMDPNDLRRVAAVDLAPLVAVFSYVAFVVVEERSNTMVLIQPEEQSTKSLIISLSFERHYFSPILEPRSKAAWLQQLPIFLNRFHHSWSGCKF